MGGHRQTRIIKITAFAAVGSIVLFAGMDARAIRFQNAGTQQQIKEFQKEAEDLSRKIDERKSRVKKYSRKETAILNRLNRVERALNDARERSTVLKAEISKIEKKMAATIAASQKLRERIQNNETYVAKRLVALYKMNWLGKHQLIASAENINDLFLRQEALERILAHDENVRENLAKDQAELQMLLAELESQKAEKRERDVEYKNQISSMSREKAKRANLLTKIRSQKALELAAIYSLKDSARQLDQQIKSLYRELDSATRDQDRPLQPFSDYKGLLMMPVKGKIVSLFGAYKNAKFNVVNFRSGIDIKADKGEPVRAVYTGRILFSSWFKGYGNMIIIDHGKNYYTVYAHVEDTFKTKGDTVEIGEVIATVGDTGSLIGPKLYFEIRHHGKPLDPIEWLRKG